MRKVLWIIKQVSNDNANAILSCFGHRILSLLFIYGHFEDIESKQGNTCAKSLNETTTGK